MHAKLSLIFLLALSVFLSSGCEDDDGMGGGDDPGNGQGDLIAGPYDPTPYELDVPSYFPGPILNPENPLTEEGIALGRKLFYETLLSRDNSMSCGSCHDQSLAFTDGLAFSFGIRGLPVRRSAMSIVNMAFNPGRFHWDGAHGSLEEQALHPVEDMLEMDDDWENVEEKLRTHPTYPQDFRAAFGISSTGELNRDLVVKAIAQFERTLISGNSRFDQVVYRNEGFFTELEEDGRALFDLEFIAPGQNNHPGCTHCHNAPNFGDNRFHNNGLDSVATLNDFSDFGLGGVNGNVFDNGKFRTPTLRNVELTAPYMHDGRFNTLEEVIEHYASGGHGVENENANIVPLELTQYEKDALVAFLKTLTDESFVTDERFSNPFE